MSKVIGIVGSRRRNTPEDFNIVKTAFINIYKPGDEICSGFCQTGADKFAITLSRQYHTPSQWYRAEWKKFGPTAGHLRNQLIAEYSDKLIACVAEDRTGGTEDTIEKYLKLGKTELILV